MTSLLTNVFNPQVVDKDDIIRILGCGCHTHLMATLRIESGWEAALTPNIEAAV